jgi:hypothetical protein
MSQVVSANLRIRSDLLVIRPQFLPSHLKDKFSAKLLQMVIFRGWIIRRSMSQMQADRLIGILAPRGGMRFCDPLSFGSAFLFAFS